VLLGQIVEVLSVHPRFAGSRANIAGMPGEEPGNVSLLKVSFKRRTSLTIAHGRIEPVREPASNHRTAQPSGDSQRVPSIISDVAGVAVEEFVV